MNIAVFYFWLRSESQCYATVFLFCGLLSEHNFQYPDISKKQQKAEQKERNIIFQHIHNSFVLFETHNFATKLFIHTRLLYLATVVLSFEFVGTQFSLCQNFRIIGDFLLNWKLEKLVNKIWVKPKAVAHTYASFVFIIERRSTLPVRLPSTGSMANQM